MVEHSHQILASEEKASSSTTLYIIILQYAYCARADLFLKMNSVDSDL